MAWCWRQLLLALLAAGAVRAGYHFVRLALLAAMGLAGMYMLHMLAQDYNKITNRPARPAAVAGKALFRALIKRDVSNQDEHAAEDLDDVPWGQHVLRQVLRQDPLGCARKLVCQLAAGAAGGGPGGLRPQEAAILRFVGHSEETDQNDPAAAEFRRAHQLGKTSKDPRQCTMRYNKCLLEPRSVLKLLQAIS